MTQEEEKIMHMIYARDKEIQELGIILALELQERCLELFNEAYRSNVFDSDLPRPYYRDNDIYFIKGEFCVYSFGSQLFCVRYRENFHDTPDDEWLMANKRRVVKL